LAARGWNIHGRSEQGFWRKIQFGSGQLRKTVKTAI
jgi:hypothetical protein